MSSRASDKHSPSSAAAAGAAAAGVSSVAHASAASSPLHESGARGVTIELLVSSQRHERVADAVRSAAAATPVGQPALRYVGALTHVDLSDRRLTTLLAARAHDDRESVWGACRSLARLYLNDNEIDDVSALAVCGKLEQLHMSHNRVRDLAPLATLAALRHLNVHANALAELPPIGALRGLTALDIGGQRTGAGAGALPGSPPRPLLVSGDALALLAPTLTVLMADECHWTTVAFLAPLTQLRTLSLRRNPLADIDDVSCDLLPFLPVLRELDTRDCPVSGMREYRAAVVVASNVTVLDGKDITPNERTFLLRRLEVLSRKPSGSRLAADGGASAAQGGAGLALGAPAAPSLRGASAATQYSVVSTAPTPAP